MTTTLKLASVDAAFKEVAPIFSEDLTDADGFGTDGGLGARVGESGGVIVSSITAAFGVTELLAGATEFLAESGVLDFASGVKDFWTEARVLSAGATAFSATDLTG